MSTLSHVAINADDLDAARTFYAHTFGWRFAPWGPPGFYRVAADDPAGPGVTAAIQQRRDLLGGRPTTGFECTVTVDHLDRAVESAVRYGGQVLMEPTTIPGVGRLVWLADPSGNVVGAMRYE
ncbi:MAG: VOC family protein [Actinocatenispora sp.]